METDTKILSSINYVNSSITFGGRTAKMIAFDSGSDITLSFTCNENGDFNSLVAEVIDKEYIDEFAGCIKAFGGGNILSIFDARKMIELQFGYDISRDIEVFFDLVDYEFDPSLIGSKPQVYSIMVEKSKREYAVLKELLTFLKDHKIDPEMKGVSDEHKFNTPKH